MRVSEGIGCFLASKGSKECNPNIYTKQATPAIFNFQLSI